MRDPATTSYLPTLLNVEPDLSTALARVQAYKAACARTEWSRTDTTEEQRRAYATIVARVASAYNRLDLGPTDREKMAKELKRLRDENAALVAVNTRLRTDNQRLTAANVAAMEGRKCA